MGSSNGVLVDTYNVNYMGICGQASGVPAPSPMAWSGRGWGGMNARNLPDCRRFSPAQSEK